MQLHCASAPEKIEDCANNATYSGPDRIELPANLLKAAFEATSNKTGRLNFELEESLNHAMREIGTKVTGAQAAILIPGKGIWTGSAGTADTKTGRDITTTDTFQIASITKVFTAIVILQLIEEGKLRSTDTLSKWFAEIKNANQITIEHLLRHTSGIANIAGLNKSTDYKKQLAGAINSNDFLFCPGSNWSYSNANYFLLGEIIEQIEGRSLQAVYDKRIIEKLGLSRTTLVSKPRENSSTTGHKAAQPVTDVNYAEAYAAGAMTSNASDLVQFWQALFALRLLSRTSIEQMFTELAPMNEKKTLYYGEGVMYYDVADGPGKMLGHSGGIQGYRSIIAYTAEDNAFIAVLFNDESASAEAGLWKLVQVLRQNQAKHK